VEAGWILKANTLGELALKASIDPEALQVTVDRYNQFCTAKHDADFMRTGQLVNILTPPFYCSEQALSVYVTYGGPMRNARSQALDKSKQPIPRLYATGEFGSFFGYRYQPGAGVPEAMSTGFAAGAHAAALKAWVTASAAK
jgi:predicted oxidoreductase